MQNFKTAFYKPGGDVAATASASSIRSTARLCWWWADYIFSLCTGDSTGSIPIIPAPSGVTEGFKQRPNDSDHQHLQTEAQLFNPSGAERQRSSSSSLGIIHQRADTQSPCANN
ncbi:hypothetical protein EYF80_023815 [Liparis tanakae]|uniref:Uncharacterized protein n=1 Tax=Liparis tanakae TaxID=230148 RepID=A0A4Z2HMD0_9TELE|nr:hypothetical protein EYF80_023815 [Liparis tanakae]